jgi:hypothetical protein
VEFGVEIGEYRGAVRVPARRVPKAKPERPTPERCVEACYSSEPGSRASPSGAASERLTEAGKVAGFMEGPCVRVPYSPSPWVPQLQRFATQAHPPEYCCQ